MWAGALKDVYKLKFAGGHTRELREQRPSQPCRFLEQLRKGFKCIVKATPGRGTRRTSDKVCAPRRP